ncbi:MAG: ethanolamine utilization protein EutH [Faecousia sp.]
MEISRIVMWIMALGALLGGADLLLGSRFGLGQRFEEAFRLLGPIGLSMAGILCLAPVLARILDWCVAPLLAGIGLDPGILGGILAIDMGGYPLAVSLAEDPRMGQLAGILISATFGCTLVFTIPLGLGILGEEDRPWFIQGLLAGLGAMGAVLILGAVIMGIPLGRALYNLMPMLAVCGCLALWIRKGADRAVKCFKVLSAGIRVLSVLGLTLGAVEYMTGWKILPGMTSLKEAMQVVCSIGIVMLGSMPLAELLRRVMERPLGWVQRKTGLNSESTTALLVGMVSISPALAAIPRMDRRGKVVVSACMVCAGSCFAAHLGYTMEAEPEMVGVLLVVKLLGGVLAVCAAMAVTRDLRPPQAGK